MRIYKIFIAFLSVFYICNVFAEILPVLAVRMGNDWVNWNSQEQDVVVQPGFLPDNYFSHSGHDDVLGSGGLVGVEWNLKNLWYLQTGISYDYLSKIEDIKGHIWQLSSPLLNDLSYQYDIQHQRADGEFKILYRHKQWYPYLTAALGIAWNRAENYHTQSSGAQVPTTPFHDTTHRSFTWSVGLGIERRVAENWRVNVGYLYTDAGDARLNADDTNNSLSLDNIEINQLLLQITYLLK